MRVQLEFCKTGDRIEGSLLPEPGGDPVPFCGVLEFIHALEQLLLGEPQPGDACGHDG